MLLNPRQAPSPDLETLMRGDDKYLDVDLFKFYFIFKPRRPNLPFAY